MSHKIGLYIRVSTEEQALRTEGSLESQKHRLHGFVDLKNMQQPGWGKIVDSYVDDGFSAKDTNRPALQRLLRDLKKGQINIVLVTDLSRLSRSVRDFCVLLDVFKDAKAKFLSLKEQFDTTTAAGEMMLFNMINLAQFERRQISERVTLNFHSRALRGLRNGGVPGLGFRVDPSNKSVLQVNEDESSYIQEIFNLYLNEGSLYKTAAELRQKRIPCRAGFGASDGKSDTIWNSQVLSSVLRNFAYAGLREVNKTNKHRPQDELLAHEKYQVVKAAWPAIIDETTFFLVQKMLDENSRLERSRLAKAKRRHFIATGVANCSECGRPLVGSTGHGRVGNVRYYVHRPIEGRPVTCSVKRYRADTVEDAITNHLLHVVHREGYLEGVGATLEEIWQASQSSVGNQRRDLEKAISQADAGIKRLVRLQMQTEDLALNKVYSEQIKELSGQRQADLDQLEKIKLDSEDAPAATVVRENVQANLKMFQKAWSKASPALQKKLVRAVISRLSLRPDGIDIHYHSDRAPELSVHSEPAAGLTDDLSVGLGAPANIISFSEKRRTNPPSLPSGNRSQNAKISGWYIVGIGCGERI